MSENLNSAFLLMLQIGGNDLKYVDEKARLEDDVHV